MSDKSSIEPPCRRFLGNDHNYINFNLIQAHQKLRDSGCKRINSIVKQHISQKFLTRINCKTDASMIKVGPPKHDVLRLTFRKSQMQRGWIFGQRQYLNETNPAFEQQLQTILTKNEQDEKLIRIDQKQIQEIQNDLTYSERYVDYLNNKYHIPQDYSQKIKKIQQLKQQVKQELVISPQTSPRKIILQKSQTFQLSPNHCVEPSLFIKDSYGARRASKLQKAEVDSIVDSLRKESKKQIDLQDNDPCNVQSMKQSRSKMLGSLLKRIQKQNQMDQSNTNTNTNCVSSPISKMKKSNSSIFATRFSRPTERSIDQINIQ
ncbi:unnamed protein product (macronuclear) [Paramecium tetraurelia]|uniref:Uncharacterized protein n=1 Tax=Paramecium tetraurelia TaxID=5888 RepID=A0DZ37_PARTE|nr:uncharacterized protein GSPATT00003273001 [Paramecium tetraurelia]CAK88304.1 unnamed protein product [Paramecium tetraurelia]|eukprot:XP_001455701.1 hypothetical protein (macronuclear) [Paramecium tetraurelia strain d4-2]